MSNTLPGTGRRFTALTEKLRDANAERTGITLLAMDVTGELPMLYMELWVLDGSRAQGRVHVYRVPVHEVILEQIDEEYRRYAQGQPVTPTSDQDPDAYVMTAMTIIRRYGVHAR